MLSVIDDFKADYLKMYIVTNRKALDRVVNIVASTKQNTSSSLDEAAADVEATLTRKNIGRSE